MIVPVAAIVMVSMFPLTPGVRGGILVMAVSSVPPLAPRKALKAGGASYTYGHYAAVVLLAAIIVPTSVALISRLYGVEIRLGLLPVLRQVLATVIAPVAAGLIVHRLAPRLAERIAPILGSLAIFVLAVAIAPIVVLAWPTIMGLIGNGSVLAMTLVSAIALAAGRLLGGPEPENRIALAMMAATRHPGIAMLIVGASGVGRTAEQRIFGAIVAFLLVGMLVAIPYRLWLGHRGKPHAPAVAVAA